MYENLILTLLFVVDVIGILIFGGVFLCNYIERRRSKNWVFIQECAEI